MGWRTARPKVLEGPGGCPEPPRLGPGLRGGLGGRVVRLDGGLGTSHGEDWAVAGGAEKGARCLES